MPHSFSAGLVRFGTGEAVVDLCSSIIDSDNLEEGMHDLQLKRRTG